MKLKLLPLLILAVTAGVSIQVQAGGYRVALQGQKANGMGHTGVAMTDSSEVIFFNPASMVFLKNDTDMSIGMSLIDSVTKYQNQAANVSAETDNPIGTPAGLYIAQRESEKLSYGIGFYTPYGNVVRWPTDWVGSHLVNNIELKAIFMQPTISYKLSDNYSFGFGPTIVDGWVKFNRNLSTSLIDANGNRSNVTIEAKGVTAMGYNLGFLAKPAKDLSVGISYRSKIDLRARDESADFENIPSSLQGAYFDTTFDADLVLPAELTVGISYDLSEDTVFAIDINRTYWGAYQSLDVQFNNGAGLSVNPRNYNDANIFRFGVQHAMNEDLSIRAGIYFDNSPINDGYFTPETPRNDATGFTAGASYQVAKGLDLDFSFLYLMFDEFYGSYDHYNQSGTIISFGGDYKSTVMAVGFGLNYKY
ncbi:MAG: outer membrane protein transport protein [Gammaproteobacteria bacterium]|nr:outer membrane protein transport protein [Gammaproteobacteria bacterium]